MKRRTFMSVGVGLASVAGSAGQAQSATRLVIGTDYPDAANALAQRVAATSGGQMTLEVREIPSADAAGLLPAAAGGNIDMYLTSQDAFVGIDPAFGLFSAMPGGMTVSELEGWIVAGDGRFMWDLLLEEYGITSYLAGDEGGQPLWSRDPITSLADLTGGTVGSVGLGLNLLEAMGVTNTVDISKETDFGSLNAVEGLSASQMAARGLLGDFSNMIAPNAARPASVLSVGVANASFDRLSDAEKTLLERCIMAEHGAKRSANAYANVVALNEAGAAITSQDMPDDIWQAQIAGANAIAGAMFDAGGISADVMDAYIYFLIDVAGWSEIGEKAFVVGRNRVLGA